MWEAIELLVTGRHLITLIVVLPFTERLCCFVVVSVFGFPPPPQSQYCRFISLALPVFLRLLYCFLLPSIANSSSLVGFAMTPFERNVQLHSVFM